MTPLAFYLTKQLIAPKREREHIWVDDEQRAALRDALYGIHCFETTGCFALIDELIGTFGPDPNDRNEQMFASCSFLPAPKTWIEWKHSSGNRIGLLIEEGEWHTVTCFSRECAGHLGHIFSKGGDYYDGYLGNPTDERPRYIPAFILDLGVPKSGAALLSTAHIMLVLINSPKIIGRRQYMPHRGLERRLTKTFQTGKFPLHAWTEIKLEVSKPIEIDDGEPHEAHLTGRRALHFVRKHIRIRLGKLEYVSAHWRGDAAIGIKQSRYKVVA